MIRLYKTSFLQRGRAAAVDLEEVSCLAVDYRWRGPHGEELRAASGSQEQSHAAASKQRGTSIVYSKELNSANL